ncbi:hypothetical protein BDV96DRAFT_575386 [Lophiotrema nucula]|uniref:Uncharacterized protein n=1 Tax=Lophiotrema nucula TaxID=690887 RepID=A0A6A5Z8Z2_9PLEO|nr:hypothetical protein BDV96DRAFT_575386 [Lophiotrema nucula]
MEELINMYQCMIKADLHKVMVSVGLGKLPNLHQVSVNNSDFDPNPGLYCGYHLFNRRNRDNEWYFGFSRTESQALRSLEAVREATSLHQSGDLRLFVSFSPLDFQVPNENSVAAMPEYLRRYRTRKVLGDVYGLDISLHHIDKSFDETLQYYTNL